jgi:hypothetical protein
MTTLREKIEKSARYDMETSYRCGDSIEELVRADDGEWMRVADVLALLPHEETPRAQEREQPNARQIPKPWEHQFAENKCTLCGARGDADNHPVCKESSEGKRLRNFAAEGIAAPPQEELQRLAVCVRQIGTRWMITSRLAALDGDDLNAKHEMEMEARDLLAAAEALTAPRADAAAGWQDISTVPDDIKENQTPILVWTPHTMALARWDNGDWWMIGTRLVIEATLWQPAPPRPTGETK